MARNPSLPTIYQDPGYYPAEPISSTYRTERQPDGTYIKVPLTAGTVDEWEKELMAYSIPKRFMAGVGKRSNPDCSLCEGNNGHEQKPCENCERLRERVDAENHKGGIARGIVSQIADVTGVDLSENVGGDRWSQENMKRVVPAVKKMRKRLTLVEGERDAAIAERDEYDREADRLAAAYEHAIIERDYLLRMREWADAELTKAYERIEELERAA